MDIRDCDLFTVIQINIHILVVSVITIRPVRFSTFLQYRILSVFYLMDGLVTILNHFEKYNRMDSINTNQEIES